MCLVDAFVFQIFAAMFRKYIFGIILITGFLLLRPLKASTCNSPDPYLQNDIITALTWNAVGRPCSNTREARSTNEFLKDIPIIEKNATGKQSSVVKTEPEKILIRKRRFYTARNPIMTCELRYFVPLFAISTELASYFMIEFPTGVDLAYPINENNAKGVGLQVYDIFDGMSDLISKLGIDGKTCVLRAICDVASITPIKPQGIIRDAMEVAINHLLKADRDSSERSNKSSSESSSESKISYLDAVAFKHLSKIRRSSFANAFLQIASEDEDEESITLVIKTDKDTPRGQNFNFLCSALRGETFRKKTLNHFYNICSSSCTYRLFSELPPVVENIKGCDSRTPLAEGLVYGTTEKNSFFGISVNGSPNFRQHRIGFVVSGLQKLKENKTWKLIIHDCGLVYD